VEGLSATRKYWMRYGLAVTKQFDSATTLSNRIVKTYKRFKNANSLVGDKNGQSCHQILAKNL